MASQPASFAPAGMAVEVTPFGGGPSENVERFLRLCDMHVRPWEGMYTEDEVLELKLATITRHLKDDARRWFEEDSPTDAREDVGLLTTALKARYLDAVRPDAALQAVRDMDKLKQGTQTAEQYIAQARRIHRDLPTAIKPRVQEVMVANMADAEARRTLDMFLDLRDIPASFEQVCTLIFKSERKRSEAAKSQQKMQSTTARPSREEEEQMRLHQMFRDTVREDREGLVTSLVSALSNLRVPANTQVPTGGDSRVTYPARADPQQERNGRRTSGDAPCYACWEFGHYSTDCPLGFNNLAFDDRRRRYDDYADKERKRGREPRLFQPNRPAQAQKQVSFQESRPIPVAAYTSADVEYEDERAQAGYLVNTDLDVGPIEEMAQPLEWDTSGFSSDDGHEDKEYSDGSYSDPEQDINCLDRYQSAAITGQRRTRADAELTSDEVPLATKAQKKTKQSTRQAGPRRIRMMEKEPVFDIAQLFRNKMIDERDGLSIGRLCDLSPQVTRELAALLVRPSNRHKFAPHTAGTRVVPESQTQNYVEALVIAPIPNLYTKAILCENKGAGAFDVQKVLLDAGSTVNFINSDLARRLKLQIFAPDFGHLKVADGKTVDIIGMVKVDIKLEEDITRTQHLYLMRGNTPFSVLLGLPALHLFRATADFRPKPLTYRIRESENTPSVAVTRVMPSHVTLIAKSTSADQPRRTCGRIPGSNANRSLRHTTSSQEVNLSDDHDSEEQGLVDQANEYAREVAGYSDSDSPSSLAVNY